MMELLNDEVKSYIMECHCTTILIYVQAEDEHETSEKMAVAKLIYYNAYFTMTLADQE